MKHDSLMHRVQNSYVVTLNKLSEAISKAENVDDLIKLTNLQMEVAKKSTEFFCTISQRGITQLVNAYHKEWDKKFLSDEELRFITEKELPNEN